MEENELVHLWLFVDKDGTEYMSNIKPTRTKWYVENKIPDFKTRLHPEGLLEFARKLEATSKTIDDWYNCIRDSDYGTFNTGDDLCLEDVVQLPKGFILQHIGKQMTYDDEPIEYTLTTK